MRSRSSVRSLVTLVAILTLSACGGGGGGDRAGRGINVLPPDNSALCNGYQDQQTSEYLLPYPVGRAYEVGQGNCSNGGHGTGQQRYAYDFRMAIGEMITAARGGNVIAVEEQYVDYDLTPGHENFVFIDHGDCTYSFYAHLTQFGALVDVGDAVDAGQDIGLSGHTGNSSWPHLHFQVGLLGGDNCDRITGQTIATTFRNTRPHPDGLQDGERYEALDPAALD